MTQDLLIKIFADYAVMPVVLLGAYALLFKVKKGQRFQAYCRVLMAGLTAYFLAKMIGQIYQPLDVRPFEQLGLEAGASFLDNPGFPSDHILFVSAIICAVWFETKQKVITLILIMLSIAIGVGRVIALVHTPVDVVGGTLIAVLGSLWYINDRKNVV